MSKPDHSPFYTVALLESRIVSNLITIPQTTLDYTLLHQALTNYKQITYVITKLEKHQDEGLHIHVVVKTKQQVPIRMIHNIIMETAQNTGATIGGTINYEKPGNINAAIQYVRKEETSLPDHPYLEYGKPPVDTRYKQLASKDKQDHNYLEALWMAHDGDTASALLKIRETNPRDYVLYYNTIKQSLDQESSTRKKYQVPAYNSSNTVLTVPQQRVYGLLSQQPTPRRIIWVTGTPGSGKSFLYNYIKINHEYGMYDAGQSASLDNVAYGYSEEGVIAWDLPRSFDFQTFASNLSAVIEKFSDFGQSVTSKKYNGKTQTIRGHVVVFTNHPPLPELGHREIIHVDLGTRPHPSIKPSPLPPAAVIDYSMNEPFGEEHPSNVPEKPLRQTVYRPSSIPKHLLPYHPQELYDCSPEEEPFCTHYTGNIIIPQ